MSDESKPHRKIVNGQPTLFLGAIRHALAMPPPKPAPTVKEK